MHYRNCLAALLVAAASGHAGEVDVTGVTVSRSGDSYRFDVSLSHADTGWDHYADRWEILSSDGEILATRVLHHPHVNEQPFTRSLTGISISTAKAGETVKVIVRGHDSVHGYAGKQWEMVLEAVD